MGVIAHPGRVLGAAVSHNGRRLLTAGAGGVVNMWAVDPAPLEAVASALADAAVRASAEAAAISEATGMAPGPTVSGAEVSATGSHTARWEALVGSPALVERLRDLFCYAQLRQAEKVAAAAARGGLATACAAAPPALTGEETRRLSTHEGSRLRLHSRFLPAKCLPRVPRTLRAGIIKVTLPLFPSCPHQRAVKVASLRLRCQT